MDEVSEERHNDFMDFFRFLDEYPNCVTAKNFEAWLAVEEENFLENCRRPFMAALQAPKAFGLLVRDFVSDEDIDRFNGFLAMRRS